MSSSTLVKRRGSRGNPGDIQIGQVFDRWTVTGAFFRKGPSNQAYIPCRCLCGTERAVIFRTIREIGAGKITGSCGCRQIEISRQTLTTHGRSKDHRFTWLWRTYGITPEEWDLLYAEQDGLCRICQTDLAQIRVNTDHDHTTGKVRGLLCHNCNVAIGHLKEDVEIMRRAILYVTGEI